MLLSFIFLPLFFPQCLSQGSTNEVSALGPSVPPSTSPMGASSAGEPLGGKARGAAGCRDGADGSMGHLQCLGRALLEARWGREFGGCVCVCYKGEGGGLESFSY